MYSVLRAAVCINTSECCLAYNRVWGTSPAIDSNVLLSGVLGALPTAVGTALSTLGLCLHLLRSLSDKAKCTRALPLQIFAHSCCMQVRRRC